VNTLDVPLGVVPNVTESQLSVDQITGNQDSGLNFTSGTDTFADVTSGFSFDIDKAQLTTATLSASGIPATTCALDANGNDINCTPTTIDVTVTWTGTGIIDRSSFNQLLKLQHGVSVVVLNQHVNGTSRSATTTGTFDGSPITGFGSGGTLGFANQSQIYLGRTNRAGAVPRAATHLLAGLSACTPTDARSNIRKEGTHEKSTCRAGRRGDGGYLTGLGRGRERRNWPGVQAQGRRADRRRTVDLQHRNQRYCHFH
jgi:hypothetical protein